MARAARVLALAALALAALGGRCHPESRVVFDETHLNLHSISNPNGYGPLADLLASDGYQVEAWTDPSQWAGLDEDVDMLVVAMPRAPLTTAEIDAADAWVSEGGVLFVITDHDPFPFWTNPLAGRFGVVSRNDTILHDGASHCPPGVPSCLQGRFSFQDSPEPSLLGNGVTHVTSYAGSSIVAFANFENVFPVFTYEAPATAALSGADVAGEHLLVLVTHGDGVVVVSSEAGMWTCRQDALPIGWCPLNVIGDGVWNDEFVLNVFADMAWYRPLSTQP